MKMIGILGGMGPAAGADMLQKITASTVAHRDQEHIPVVLFSNTAVPDRTAAILAGGSDPRPELIRSARVLADAGAEILVIACNTAHYYYDDVASAVDVPVLHMPRETAAFVRESGLDAVALLSTSGTVSSGVYAHAFEREAPDVKLLLPDADGQEALMSLIYDGVKKGRLDHPADAVRRSMERLCALGAKAFILGCTELPVASELGMLPWPSRELIDPTLIVARSAVRAAGGRCV